MSAASILAAWPAQCRLMHSVPHISTKLCHMRQQKLVNNRQVTATKSQSGSAHPCTQTQASIQRKDTATSSNFIINDVSYSVVPFCLDYLVVTLELEQLPLLAGCPNLMTHRMTAALYTYRPEERMQKQRMVYISSPAVRITYTKMAPPVFAPTVLDKTPRERTCPRREARGSEGPRRGRR